MTIAEFNKQVEAQGTRGTGKSGYIRVTDAAPTTFADFAAIVTAAYAQSKELPSAYITEKGIGPTLYIPTYSGSKRPTTTKGNYMMIPRAAVAQWLREVRSNKSEVFYTLVEPAEETSTETEAK